MVRTGLSNRVEALEQAAGQGLKRWVRVVQSLGQTQEAAIATWEADNGPVGDSNIMVVKIV